MSPTAEMAWFGSGDGWISADAQDWKNSSATHGLHTPRRAGDRGDFPFPSAWPTRMTLPEIFQLQVDSPAQRVP
jgi:hypothetical protein